MTPARHARVAGLALLWGALIFGGLLRLGAARIGSGAGEFCAGDWDYYGAGVQAAETGQFRPHAGATASAFRMPLYPSAISLLRRVSPGIGPLRLVQALLDWAAVAVVYAAAAMLGGGLCGGLAAALYALFDPAIMQSRVPMSETFFGLLILVALCAWLRCARDGKSGLGLLPASVLLGVAMTCRSTLFLAPPLLGLFFPARGRKARLRTAAVCVLGSYLLLVPWTARNAALLRAFVPFENGAASLNLWGASAGILENPHMTELLASGRHRDFLLRAQQAPDSERPGIYFAESARNIRREPVPFVLNFFRRLPVLWSEQWLLLLLALPLLRGAARPKGAGLTLLLLAYFCVHAFMGTSPRYARPVAGAACIAAALGLVSLGRFGDAKPSLWPERLSTGAAALLTCVYLASTVQLAVEVARRRAADPGLPSEYEDAPARYTELKRLNAEAVGLAFQGRPRDAERVLGDLLRREPSFAEGLVNRAVLRGMTGDRNGAARDERALLALLEFPSGLPASGAASARLNRF